MKAADVLPPLAWLPGYGRETLLPDLRAAATVGVLIVPQAMAYAALAGMPPITGLYAAIVALVVYSVLGTSRFASPGPAAIDALLVAAAVGPLADGDPRRYVALAGTLAVLSGLLQVIAGGLRLGALVSFVSVPVILGFTTAAALTIAATQLPVLLGLPVTPDPAGLVRTLDSVAPELGRIDVTTAAFAVGCLLVLALLRRRLPVWLPAPIVLLVLAAGVAALPWLDARLQVIGEVPRGLPVPVLPSLDLGDATALLPAAVALALVSFLESFSSATAFARRSRSRMDANQELIALGAGNVAAGFFRGFNVAAGASRGAVMFSAGSRTPMSCLLAAVVVGTALLTITPLLALLPSVALAAIIVLTVWSLVDLRGAIEVARVRRTDLIALLAAFVATAGFGPLPGLAVGVAVSLTIFLRQTAHPHFPELGRVEGTHRYRNLARYTEIHTDPAVLLLRLDAPLYFANSQAVGDRIADLAASRPGLRHVVFDASGMSWLDYSGTETLTRLDRALRESGIELHLAALRGPPRDILRRTRHGRWLADHGRLHPDVQTAVEALRLGPDSPLNPADGGAAGPST